MIKYGLNRAEPGPYVEGTMAGRPPSTEGTVFGRRVAEFRKRKGLTQAELAAILDVTAPMIVYCERRAANPSLELLLKLSKALDVTVSELVGEEPASKRKPGPPSELDERVERVRHLPKKKQELAVKMLDVVLDGG